ncbi:L,D-transpeptidase family protein [Blautia liquoris]|nr:L,D-transpeptidase family protein [Blautia liquoris]
MKKKKILIVTIALTMSLGTQVIWADNAPSTYEASGISNSSEEKDKPADGFEDPDENKKDEVFSDDSLENKTPSPENESDSELLPQNAVQEYSNTITPEDQKKIEFHMRGIDAKLSKDGSNVTVTPQYTSNVDSTHINFRYLIYDLQKLIWTEIPAGESDDSSCVWQPSQPGTYWIHVIADPGNGTEYTSTIGYVIQGARLGDFSMDHSSSQPWDTAITLHGSIVNPLSEELTYEYLVYDGRYWMSLYKSEELKDFTYTADKPGSYLICYQVYNAEGVVIGQKFLGYDAQELSVRINAIHANISVSGGVDLSIDGGTNDSQTEFKWVSYDLTKKQWILIQDWSTKVNAHWSPKSAGPYWIQVEGKTRTGQTDNMLIGYNVKDIKITSFTSDISSPKAIGTTIGLSGTVENPMNQKLQYRYIVYDGTTWRELYSSDNLQKVYYWKPEQKGNYLLCLEVTGPDGKVYQSFMSYQIQALSTKLKNLQVYTPDYRTYYIMQNVDSNDGNLKYKYQIYDLRTKQWHMLSSGGVNTYWQPKTSGDYWIHASIVGSDGKEYTQTIGYHIKGYSIGSFGFSGNLEAGKTAKLSASGYNYLGENYTFTYLQWNGSGWNILYRGNSPSAVNWTPPVSGDYAFCCQVSNPYGVVDTKTIHISNRDFTKTGWYYENGYKFYYINNQKQLDLDGILPRQSSYIARVNRTTCTVTIYAADGGNGYIIPVKRFACSVGLPGTPTPTGTYRTSVKYRWHELMGPSFGQYCTRIVGGILFHSVAGSNTTSFNLNPSEYNKLGKPASHGCVRLSVRDAKWIYDNCKIGMQVTIYDSSNAGPLGQGPVYRITNPGQNWDPTDPNV